MSKKKSKPYDIAVLARELVAVATEPNKNYSPSLDGVRVEACELILKHSSDEKSVTVARDVLVEISGSTSGALAPHRVRAIRVLLENQKIFGAIDAVNEVES